MPRTESPAYCPATGADGDGDGDGAGVGGAVVVVLGFLLLFMFCFWLFHFVCITYFFILVSPVPRLDPVADLSLLQTFPDW